MRGRVTPKLPTMEMFENVPLTPPVAASAVYCVPMT